MVVSETQYDLMIEPKARVVFEPQLEMGFESQLESVFEPQDDFVSEPLHEVMFEPQFGSLNHRLRCIQDHRPRGCLWFWFNIMALIHYHWS